MNIQEKDGDNGTGFEEEKHESPSRTRFFFGFGKSPELCDIDHSDIQPRSTQMGTLNGLIDWVQTTTYTKGRKTLPTIAENSWLLKWCFVVPLFELIFTTWFWAVVVPEHAAPKAEHVFVWVMQDESRRVKAISCWAFCLSVFVVCGILKDVLTCRMLDRGTKRVVLPKELPRLVHVVMICQYKEPYLTLQATIESISKMTLAKSCIVVLASEERDRSAAEKFANLKQVYGSSFLDFFDTSHPLVVGEVAGKASNENYAARRLYEYVKDKGWDPFYVMVTICDADSIFDTVFLEQLEGEFWRQPDGRRSMYEMPINCYRNTPACNILVQAFEIKRSDETVSTIPLWCQSNYAITLGFLHEIDFWDPTVISEDSHIYFRALAFGTGPLVRVWSIVLNDAVTTITNRWTQAKRHRWGFELFAWGVPLYQKLRIFTWLTICASSHRTGLACLTPTWIALVFPQFWMCLHLYRSFQLSVFSLIIVMAISWVRLVVRDLWLRRSILAKRACYLHVPLWNEAIVYGLYPVLELIGTAIFHTCAAWVQLVYALNHRTIAFTPSPKALFYAKCITEEDHHLHSVKQKIKM